MSAHRRLWPPAVSTAAAVVVLATWGTPLPAWGPMGHRLAAASTMQTLPRELRAWYLDQEEEFIQAALEPDLWKAQDATEAWRHRIACETYGGPARLPLQAAAAKTLIGAWAFEQGGQLPWVIAERHRLLVEAFQSRDRRRVISESGWLCHYVSDAQVPLHTTQNRNGKSTGQKGVHKRWETDLVNHGVGSLPALAEARPVGDLPATIAGWIAESHAMVQPLLDADRAAGRESLPRPETRTAALWSLQKQQVVQQLSRSTERSGALILSAWIQAGSPRP